MVVERVPTSATDLIAEFRQAWQAEPVSIPSGLSWDEAARRLSDGISKRGGRAGQTRFDASARIVKGYVTPERIRIYASPEVQTRNSWRPVFNGRVAPSPRGGSELTGELGPDPAVVLISVVILVVGALFFLTGVTALIADLAAGRWSALLFPAAFIGGSLLLGFFIAALSVVASRYGKRDGEYLKRWLRDQINPDNNAVG